MIKIMDLIDKKLLCELDLNCRSPLSKIARKLRVNRNVVSYRIKKLEEKEINRYVCSLNLGLLGYKTYKVYFKVQGSKPRMEEQFIKDVISNKQVISFLKTEGAFDYSLAIAVRTILELDEFLMGLKNSFQDFIKDYFVSIVVYTKIFKLNKLLLGQKQGMPKFERFSGEEETVQIDEKDKAILKELAQHANMPIVDLAKKTGLSIDIVKYRLKGLSNGVINSFRAIFNLDRMGYYHYVLMLKVRQATKKDEEKLVGWCASRQEVIYCTKRIGYFDFEIHTAVRNIDELNSIISALKEEFSELIESYEMVINTKLLKLDYVPF